MRVTWVLYVAVGMVAIGGQLFLLFDLIIPARTLISGVLWPCMLGAAAVMNTRRRVRRRARPDPSVSGA